MVSIRKRLLFSNIAMVVIPIFCMIIVEISLGYFFFVAIDGDPTRDHTKLFVLLRFTAMMLILVITNGVLTYYVSKTIIKPIQNLSLAAQRISEGELNYRVIADKKDELGQLANTFEEMRLKLKEAKIAQQELEQNRQELIVSISHDLKTPLTSIKGYIKGIQDGVANTPDKFDRYMKIIDKSANDMDRLLDELFLYSKLDLAQIPYQFERLDLSAFFADVVDELSLVFLGEVLFSASKADDYIVQADREKIKRLVMNILQNSLKYMDKEQSIIEIYLSSMPHEVMVEIKDNGSGIKDKDLPFIFDSFYRTDTSRNSTTGGSGLGLAIAKKIVEGHGGQIGVKSEWEKGTSIYFTLKKVIQDEKSFNH